MEIEVGGVEVFLHTRCKNTLALVVIMLLDQHQIYFHHLPLVLLRTQLKR